ncbi:MAG: methyltransferase domain-containing protein [Mariprofundaceae bacterium]|nr:methyltransferase domain-containing protein [Mariprofundaceae bacterium]
MPAQQDWEDRYLRGETGWDRGGTSPALTHWLTHTLKAPARVLIPGCGRGHEVIMLARLGFSVTAIDIAPSAVAHLKQELARAGLSAEVILGDLFTYSPDEPFDVVYEQTCLCAIQPGQRKAYEERLHAWLKPGGIRLALFMQADSEGGPPFHCAVNDMQQLFPASRWDWPDAGTQNVPHHSGRFELGHSLTRK